MFGLPCSIFIINAFSCLFLKKEKKYTGITTDATNSEANKAIVTPIA